MRKLLSLLIILICQLNLNTVTCQNIEIDKSFGEEGFTIIPENLAVGIIHSYMTIQPDDKILSLTENTKAQIVRMTKSGDLDKEFGINGIASANLEGNIRLVKVALQPDNKILLLGTLGGDILLVRFNEDGMLDEGFGNNGVVITKLENATVFDVDFQQNEKFIVVGQQHNFFDAALPDNDFLLVGYNKDGSLNNDFGNQGIVVSDFDSRTERFANVHIKEDGKILVAGFIENRSRNFDIILARYNALGVLDTTFATNGKNILDIEGGDDFLTFMNIQADGKIVLSGTAFNRVKEDIALVRFDEHGKIDSLFGKHGITLTDLSGSDKVVFQSKDRVNTVLHKLDGSILVHGYSFVSNIQKSRTYYVQYDKNGELDANFGKNGILIPNEPDPNALFLGGLANQSDGKIIAGGRKNIDGKTINLFTRFFPDLSVGTIDFLSKENNALVYPNPIKTTATLEYTLEKSEILTIQLTDLHGRTLKTYLQNQPQKAGDYQQVIDLSSDLPKGMYFIKLSSPTGQMMVKVMK